MSLPFAKYANPLIVVTNQIGERVMRSLVPNLANLEQFQLIAADRREPRDDETKHGDKIKTTFGKHA